MDLSRKWLNEFVDLSDISDREFDEAMTLSGSKVEVVTRPCDDVKGVVVGKILEMARHENSDHMWVCQIDVGQGSPVQIVTGAQNQKVGDLVPVCLDGSELPGGKRIESGVLRGVESRGMCCSYQELGMTDHDWPHSAADGLFILNSDPDIMAENPQPGDDINKFIGFDDSIVEFEITPNRPDCLSVIGLAREASATFDRPLKMHTPEVKGCGGDAGELVKIEIEDPALCPRYTARMVRNVKIAPSPKWLRDRLRSSGVRPINNIVDITNYVMLEYGQPMHAFDFSCVDGGRIVVRTAREGESIQTLDGNDRALTTNMLCICDGHKPVCVAGVMGGANSEIVGDTAMVLFESANFNGVSVRRTAAALGMRTDASSRFEKGLDVMNTVGAVDRACELVEMLACGEVVDGVVDVFPNVPEQTKVMLEPEKINALLGTSLGEDAMRDILKRLGFELDGDIITVPSWRGDVSHYSDIAEEVARFYGYNKIPNTLLRGETTRGGYSDIQKFERALGNVCRSCGCSEIVTYSFVSPAVFDKIRMPEDDPRRDTFKILNPLGEDTSVMRTAILPSMLDILAHNRALRNDNVRLYEIGKIYLKNGGRLADEPKKLVIGGYGADMDFYALKGIVESVLKTVRISGAEYSADTSDPAYHPGRCAEVTVGGKKIGVLGEVHPAVAKNYDVDTKMYVAELDFAALYECAGATPVYAPLPKFPATTRDLAVVCDTETTVGSLEKTIAAAGKPLLRGIELFDIYTGTGIPEGKKSVAFSLVMRSDTATLTDEEVDAVMENILECLKREQGAVIR
ncbi:MAG: phenylalanine--tRNA ligase subunit beta [Oscillospiraceae bacterium]|nr:phenylalanine--tRNA ligase subunit beta [Oscillospiraceae bacterium]